MHDTPHHTHQRTVDEQLQCETTLIQCPHCDFLFYAAKKDLRCPYCTHVIDLSTLRYVPEVTD
jgi:rubrerythrin